MEQQDFIKVLEASPVWERFNDWYYSNKGYKFDNYIFNGALIRYTHLPSSFQLAALIDWLDSEGVEVQPIKDFQKRQWYCKISDMGGEHHLTWYKSRSEATKAGILKAFELLSLKAVQPY